MAIIDNTLASRVDTFDPATPLKQAAALQAAEMDQRQQQFKLVQAEVGAEARGLQAFVNTPEFPQRWAEGVDRLAQKGVLPPQIAQEWRTKPSPLMLKSLIQQTSDPALEFRKQEAGRDQANTEADRALRVQEIGIRERALNKRDVPSGFEPSPEGGLRPIKGGPNDPEYLRTKGDRQNAPSGYAWNDPSDPSKGLKAIPGGPGEKVDAEVAGRLGLAKNFLSQLPEIKADVANGDATGAWDATKAYAGVGKPGAIRRKIDSGAEALLRMLTGAGMNKDEAAEYTRRYKLSPTDTAANVIDKLTQLEGELNSVGETVGKGRGGWESMKPVDKPKTTGATGPTREIPPGAIEALRADKSLKDQFEAKYGKGTASVVLK